MTHELVLRVRKVNLGIVADGTEKALWFPRIVSAGAAVSPL